MVCDVFIYIYVLLFMSLEVRLMHFVAFMFYFISNFKNNFV